MGDKLTLDPINVCYLNCKNTNDATVATKLEASLSFLWKTTSRIVEQSSCTYELDYSADCWLLAGKIAGRCQLESTPADPQIITMVPIRPGLVALPTIQISNLDSAHWRSQITPHVHYIRQVDRESRTIVLSTVTDQASIVQ